VKLTTTGFGPGNCEAFLDRQIETLLAKESGWLVYTAHGLVVRQSIFDRFNYRV